MEGNDRSQGSLMEKTFRGRVRSSVAVNSDQSSGKMATGNPDDSLHWPSIAGPSVPENNPKLWKAPKLDMASSLAVLRRELVSIALKLRSLNGLLNRAGVVSPTERFIAFYPINRNDYSSVINDVSKFNRLYKVYTTYLVLFIEIL